MLHKMSSGPRFHKYYERSWVRTPGSASPESPGSPQTISLHVTPQRLCSNKKRKRKGSGGKTCKAPGLHLFGDGTHACNSNLKGLAQEWPDPATGKLSEPTANDITFVEVGTTRRFMQTFSPRKITLQNSQDQTNGIPSVGI